MSLDSELALLMRHYNKGYICILLDEVKYGYHGDIISNIPMCHLSLVMKCMTDQLDRGIQCEQLSSTSIVYRNEKKTGEPDGRIQRAVCPVYDINKKKS